MGRLIRAVVTGVSTALLLAAPAWAASFSSRYDPQFRAWSAAYLPAVDWRLLKAQCYQESRLSPTARSPVGAMGLCQFMPATWDEAARELRLRPGSSAYSPEGSIQAAAWYMRRLRAVWRSPRPEYDRHSLALASYNAGAGNLLAAQRRCNGAALYQDIAFCLPRVTGRHAAETLHYVPAIWGFYREMSYGLRTE
jgi:soluble lytic murein transglycosylase-like protein